MAKVKMVCPITGGPCVECAIYRGRHYYLCYSAGYKGRALDVEALRELEAAGKKEDPGETFGMPEGAEVGPKCIKNVEELTIEIEFRARR